MLNDIANQVTTKNGPKQAFETMLGDSAPEFFQSLRVTDWTLLYFKLQSRIPDQGWQTMLNLTKLGRTGVHTMYVVKLLFICFFFLKDWINISG